MPFSISDLCIGFVLPAVLAAAIAVVMRVIPWGPVGQRQASAYGLGLAFAAGYALLKLGGWVPEESFEWMLYLLPIACLCGPIVSHREASHYEQIVLFAVVAVAAAWFLVPTWPTLEPSRVFWVLVAIALMFTVAWLVELLAAKVRSELLVSTLAISSLVGAVLLLLSASARFCQIELAMTGALAGVAAASCWRGEDEPARGLGLPFAVGMGGMMLVGRLYSFTEIPTASYFMVAFAPCVLLLGVAGPLRRLTGLKGVVVRAILLASVLIMAIVIAVVADPSIVEAE